MLFKQLVGSVFLVGAVIALQRAVEQNSTGWGAVAICLVVFVMVGSVGEQLARVLDRLDEMTRAPGK